MSYLELKEVYTHNLKGIDLKIPLNSLVVITGPSGSGKSSLAINTIAEEAKNRLFQILNYSQEVSLNVVPKAKFVSPLPPIIAMTQGVKNWHPYKTIGEFLFLYQTLRLLFEEFGEYKCPACGEFNKVTNLNKIIKWYQNLKEGEKFYFLLPLPESSPKALEFLISQGYTKYIIDDKEIDLSEESIPAKIERIYLLLDRMVKEKGSMERFLENLRISQSLNQGRIILKFLKGGEYFFNLKPICLRCGTQLLTEWIKCKSCKGYGYKGKEVCKDCEGLKITSVILESKLLGKSIKEWLILSIKEFYYTLKELNIPEGLKSWFESIFFKLEKALFLEIDYLKLSTPVFNLSIGERKLLELLLIFGINLNKVIYILDEPTLGLDIDKKKKLLILLRNIINHDNSVILIEHDPYIIENADYIIELGPEGGERGGYLIKADFKEEFFKKPDTLTSQYLKGKRKLIDLSFISKDYPKEKKLIEVFVEKQKVNLLKEGINLIYGKIGSKKTLFFEKLYEVLKKEGKILKIEAKELKGRDDLIISYTGIWDDLKEILIKLPSARIKGLTQKNFSFHTKEGVCSSCRGKGKRIWETENLKLSSICEECFGKRLNPEVLNLTYKGFKISEIFDFTIEEILSIFSGVYQIKEKVQLLKELNLSYLKLGQSIEELSGGERNRLFIAKKLLGNIKFDYLFLEYPLQGLHLEDIKYFANWLNTLKRKNITIVILDTNLITLFLSEWIIEIKEGKPKFMGYPKDWLKTLEDKNFKEEILFYHNFFDK
ncbi:ABC transporter related protein [Thermodesulfobacterium geofontis OPF15]|uniref:UvrABC system protein A n=1 Tax=Thermodesulfobacterium geofontis (strain OPF15) TaxID=795359 RepID=F8C3E7_THEGP|nr:AAA family ATPase [Thermodesulfobacterium geofontis]AEH23574.1 ABC transporter related protein [Thermodesulfobacterium geofontis OPF15]